MILLTLFAFFAGVVTVLSPCILPVLPIVLSGSVAGGKSRPLGIVFGFIVSFTFFTLSLSTLVRVLGISADSLRLLSVLVLFGFGISMFVPAFQAFLETFFSKLTGVVPRVSADSGFFGGVLVGFCLGLLWTPCVGPILASVISLALIGSVSGTAVLITLAYATGTGIPMLAITYGGRALLLRTPLLSYTPVIQKFFGILMMLTAIGIFFNVDRRFQTYILETFPQYGVGLTAFEDTKQIQKELEKLQVTPMPEEDIGKPLSTLLEEKLGKAPELIPGGQWFNSNPLTLAQLRGKVVLIDFWTYTCINCIRTLPYLRSWHEKYAGKGLVIIGVHTPEFEFEKNPENVETAIKDFGLLYPIVQDNDYATWRAYNNRYWPAKYFIDKNGIIRWTHFGEGEYDESEKVIQELLAETGVEVTETAKNPSYTITATTPELYLGYDRITALSSPEQLRIGKTQTYSFPSSVSLHTFALNGTWTIQHEYALSTPGAALTLRFEAKDVFLVLRATDKQSGKMRVSLDGKTISSSARGSDVDEEGVVTVTTQRLYHLIHLPEAGTHELLLDFLDPLELYAFTFG